MSFDPPLSKTDSIISELIQKEKHRQLSGLELIASENLTSRAVMEAVGSCLTNKYSEGLPGKRYYGGNEYIDQIERLCQDRALQAYDLDPTEWGVNVQPLSGSPANFAVFTGLLNPNDRIMGLDLPSGGHLSHGFMSRGTPISAPAKYFQSFGYRLNKDTGLIDYDELESIANRFYPKLIIVGGSAYPRDWDYVRARQIADSVGAYLMSDMAHISGLVLAKEHRNPFDYCDVVTTTTHKTLRGPRSGLIFYKKKLAKMIDSAVFPGCQGGPHNHAIAGVAVALKEAMTPEFKTYIQQVKANAQVMAEELLTLGYQLVTGGTDNHLVLWDLRHLNLTGSKIETLGDLCDITVNKNSVPGDKSALSPGGIRLGTPALTTRGFGPKEIKQVVHLLHQLVKIALEIQKESGKQLVDFKKTALDPNKEFSEQLMTIKKQVNELATGFPLPGV